MLQEAEECRGAQEEGRLAAGQDLDIRRMELEAQRRRLEQVILFRLPALIQHFLLLKFLHLALPSSKR